MLRRSTPRAHQIQALDPIFRRDRPKVRDDMVPLSRPLIVTAVAGRFMPLGEAPPRFRHLQKHRPVDIACDQLCELHAFESIAPVSLCRSHRTL